VLQEVLAMPRRKVKQNNGEQLKENREESFEKRNTTTACDFSPLPK
jgi:hypothetical protein